MSISPPPLSEKSEISNFFTLVLLTCGMLVLWSPAVINESGAATLAGWDGQNTVKFNKDQIKISDFCFTLAKSKLLEHTQIGP